jgi:hypothetical protein
MAPDPRRTSLARHGGDRRRVGALGSARSSRRSFDPTHTLARGRPWRRAWTIIEGRAASRIPTIPGRLSGKSELQTGPLGVTRHLSAGSSGPRGSSTPQHRAHCPRHHSRGMRLHIGKAGRRQRPRSAVAFPSCCAAQAAILIFRLLRGVYLGSFAPTLTSGNPRPVHCGAAVAMTLILPEFRGRAACSRRSSCLGRRPLREEGTFCTGPPTLDSEFQNDV